MTDLANLLGSVAGFCTTIAFLPQVIRIWKTRQARDVSLAMYAIFLVGILLWLAYGCVLGAVPIIVTNLCSLVLAGAVLLMKLHFSRQGETTLSTP